MFHILLLLFILYSIYLLYDPIVLFIIFLTIFVNFLYSSLFLVVLGFLFHNLYSFSLVLQDFINSLVIQSFLGFMLLVLLAFLVYSALLRHIFILSIRLFKAIFGSFICVNSFQFILTAGVLSFVIYTIYSIYILGCSYLIY